MMIMMMMTVRMRNMTSVMEAMMLKMRRGGWCYEWNMIEMMLKMRRGG